MSKKTALIVEDTDANRIFLERLLAPLGYKIFSVSKGKSALQLTREMDTLSLAVIDLEIPGMSGYQLLSQFRTQFPECILVMATMHDSPQVIRSAFEKGCNIFIVKPHGFMQLFKLLSDEDTTLSANATFLLIDQYGPRPFEQEV